MVSDDMNCLEDFHTFVLLDLFISKVASGRERYHTRNISPSWQNTHGVGLLHGGTNGLLGCYHARIAKDIEGKAKQCSACGEKGQEQAV